MHLKGYKRPNKEYWYGRVDDDEDYESFRWHQHIKLIDLSSSEKIVPNSYIIIGYEVDEGITRNKGRNGAKYAPNLIRASLSNKSCSFDQKIVVYDGGNVWCINEDVEAAQATLSLLVEKVLNANAFPIVLGGGHDVAYGSVSGISRSLDESDSLGIINFDAHFDNRPYTKSTSGTMFRQIYDDFKLQGRAFNHLTIGVQKSANTISLFKNIEEIGSNYILARDIVANNSYHNVDVIKKFLSRNDHIYITICCDVFASSFAPGVSSPQPLGVNAENFMEFFKIILDSKKVICLDIAEASPELDTSNITISLVSLIVYTLINYRCENDLVVI